MFSFEVLGLEPRAFCILGKFFIIERQSQNSRFLMKWIRLLVSYLKQPLPKQRYKEFPRFLTEN